MKVGAPDPCPINRLRLRPPAKGLSGHTVVGTEVRDVRANSTAAAAGLRSGMVITSVNGLEARSEGGKRLLEDLTVPVRAGGPKAEWEMTFYTPPQVRWPAADGKKGQLVPWDPTPRYLGVVYDYALSFENHVDLIAARMEKRLRVLTALAASQWGCHADTLRRTYTALVTAAKLDVIQNRAARLITGYTIGTNTKVLLAEADLEPLDLRADMLRAVATERYRRLPADAPARRHLRSMGRTTNRDGTTSEDLRAATELEGGPPECFAPIGLAPWGQPARVEIRP
eukprot:gene5339-1840_t